MIPHATEKLEGWRLARRRTGRMLLALDYDGTLAPIASRPEDAQLAPATREVLARLAARPDTDVAVVSGRALEDVRERVGLADLYYAGNHGLEIEGPGLQHISAEAVSARPYLERCIAVLDRAVFDVPGVILEDKGITLSVHYRLVTSEAEAERIRTAVLEACAGIEQLRATEGKRVVEVRPNVEWDKGRATQFLLDALELSELRQVPVIFIGDDRTDEDAFSALRGRGDGVLVADGAVPDTAATSFLRSVDEVVELLEALAVHDVPNAPDEVWVEE